MASGLLAIFLTILAPADFLPSALAQQNKSPAPAANKTTNTQPKPPVKTNTNQQPVPASDDSGKLFNPIKYTNLGDLIVSITKNFLLFLAIVTVAFIVLGGAQLVISAGNEEAIKKGKSTITWAIIGLVLALLAFSIVAIVEDLIGANY